MHKKNILIVEVMGEVKERVPILAEQDVKRLAEGFKSIYKLYPGGCWSIYFYKSSSMNIEVKKEVDYDATT